MVLIIDPQIAGLSGDMILCSLVDLGANKKKILDGIKQSESFFPNSSIRKLDFQKIQKHGISATELILELDEESHERKGVEIKKAIVDSTKLLGLSDKAQTFAKSSIDSLISSESKIHGVAESSVHFHEASSIDTLIDIVGISIALDDLNLFSEKILCLPVSVGNGTVTFSHGTMSNPAGAILEIFKNSNLKIKGSPADDELTTPTGACIITNLSQESIEFYPPMKINSIGYGAGQKDFETFSNVLKIVRGFENNFDIDSVKILETNLDDVSGEILGNLIEKIMAKNAKDISIYPGITKKGRPTNLISIICENSNFNEILDTLILETGTLGVRISDSNRFIVPRTIHSISLILEEKQFLIHFKKSHFKDHIHFKIEFNDLKIISESLDKSIKETESLIRKEIEKTLIGND